ncbi:MAG: uroporphyrinogen decarboxylase family protein [Clostridia bacterium]|nr:uroporphyrinogen decarboxylase family protein [Clostridia bacterium]
MDKLSSRERLTRLLNKQEIDRVPIWLLFPYHKYGSYVDVYNIPCYKRITDYIEKYCDTFDRRSYDTGFCYNANPGIISSWNERKDGNNTCNEYIVEYKGLKLNKYTSRGPDGTKVKQLVDDIDDLEKILSIPYIAPRPVLDSYYKEKEELGDRGLMMVNLNDPLGPLYSIMSAEDFSMATATDYNKLIEFTDVMNERVMAYTKYLLEEDVGEVFFIIGAEFAGPPLVSPERFNELSARYVKGIVDLIREYGKKSIVHYHGNLYKILDGIKYIDPDGLHTIEAPPIGDCTISQAGKVLGDMVLIGNIQYDDLAHCGSMQIEDLVRSAMDEGKSGRFILSPTAGPYEELIPQKMIDNYITFIDAGIKYGKY